MGLLRGERQGQTDSFNSHRKVVRKGEDDEKKGKDLTESSWGGKRLEGHGLKLKKRDKQGQSNRAIKAETAKQGWEGYGLVTRGSPYKLSI